MIRFTRLAAVVAFGAVAGTAAADDTERLGRYTPADDAPRGGAAAATDTELVGHHGHYGGYHGHYGGYRGGYYGGYRGYYTGYRGYYGGWGYPAYYRGGYYGGFGYPRFSIGFSTYYAPPVYYAPTYYGYSSYYYGGFLPISGGPSVSVALSLGGKAGPDAVPTYRPAATPAPAEPAAPGTFRYDGGPAAPVPMPAPDAAPAPQPMPPPAAEPIKPLDVQPKGSALNVSLRGRPTGPAKPVNRYPAYGEK
jgi:hypothetical protein